MYLTPPRNHYRVFIVVNVVASNGSSSSSERAATDEDEQRYDISLSSIFYCTSFTFCSDECKHHTDQNRVFVTHATELLVMFVSDRRSGGVRIELSLLVCTACVVCLKH